MGGALTIGVVLRENVAQLRTHRDSPGFEELVVANCEGGFCQGHIRAGELDGFADSETCSVKKKQEGSKRYRFELKPFLLIRACAIEKPSKLLMGIDVREEARGTFGSPHR